MSVKLDLLSERLPSIKNSLLQKCLIFTLLAKKAPMLAAVPTIVYHFIILEEQHNKVSVNSQADEFATFYENLRRDTGTLYVVRWALS